MLRGDFQNTISMSSSWQEAASKTFLKMVFSQLFVESGCQFLVLEQCHAMNQHICGYHIYVCVFVHALLYVCVCIHLCIHVCVHIYVCTHICVCFVQSHYCFTIWNRTRIYLRWSLCTMHLLACQMSVCVAFKCKLTPLFVDSTILQCFWRVFHLNLTVL